MDGAQQGWRRVASAAGLLGADGTVAQTVFAEMTALAGATGAVNLGQGFPDEDGPASLLEDAVRAVRSGVNQYPPGPGSPELREAVAAHQRDWWGLDVHADDVLVTTGATEAVSAAVLALCQPGDEVVALEPAYDSYGAAVALAGARLRTVPLRWPDFRLDAALLEAAVGPRTRLLLVNSPHNPTGRVLTREELATVADVARRHDLLVLTDEVYEHLVFDGHEHVPLASLPGMAERTLTASSAGKTFSVTGWKIGWVHGPREAVEAVRTVKQYLTFTTGAPFQPAVARALGGERAGFAQRTASLQRRRDLLVDGLRDAGFDVAVPEGTYFVLADARPLGHPDGAELARRLPHLAGVVAVPAQVFCSDPTTAPSLVRFAFCKREDVLEEAVRRLQSMR